MKFLRSLASQAAINKELRRWPRLHAYYRSASTGPAYKIPQRPPAPNHIKALAQRALEEAEEQLEKEFPK